MQGGFSFDTFLWTKQRKVYQIGVRLYGVFGGSEEKAIKVLEKEINEKSLTQKDNGLRLKAIAH